MPKHHHTEPFPPINCPPISHTLAYIDSSLTLYFRCWPGGILDAINAVNNGGKCWPEPCRDKEGNTRGFYIKVARPTIKALDVLDLYLLIYRGTITRCDIAFDLFPQNDADIDDLHKWLVVHLYMRHRQPGPMLDYPGVLYWVAQWKLKRRMSQRDVVVYSDRLSKLAGRLCCHVEVRLQTSTAITKAGIYQCRDLLKISPAKLFNDCLRLVHFDPQQWTKNKIRETMKDYRSKRKASQSRSPYMDEFMQNYEKGMPGRLQEQLKIMTWGYNAQLAKQLFKVGTTKEIDSSLLNLPTKLSFASLKSLNIFTETDMRVPCHKDVVPRYRPQTIARYRPEVTV